MAKEKQQLNLITSDQKNTKALTPKQLLINRESKELVIAFSGPVGCGVNTVAKFLEQILKNHGYSVKTIKISDIIKKCSEQKLIDANLTNLNKAEKYAKLQDAGNALREKFETDILAQLAVSKIVTQRTLENADKEVKEITPQKNAYIIDQLKHPAEVELLRAIYGNLFYLVGVFSSEEQTKSFLKSNFNLEAAEALEVIEKDRKDEFSHGQQLEKTLKMADLFIRNTTSNNQRIIKQLERFCSLIHGKNGITPTSHEYAMYVAYSVSLKSACLSRQVGASIADREGNILSTGCNDVPKAGGGLYTEDDGANDERCVKKDEGKCFNDFYKNKNTEKIVSVLIKEMQLEPVTAKILAEKIKTESGIANLIEYSRSVHAEMDALIKLARKGGRSTEGTILYSTTYPCHSCARHIISAGIKKVFYIEPYEKSLALELHRDAIKIDPEEDQEEHNYVQFLHFEGIAPRLYQGAFLSRHERKDSSGKALDVIQSNDAKKIVELLDGYMNLETKVFEHLQKERQIPVEVFGDNSV